MLIDVAPDPPPSVHPSPSAPMQVQSTWGGLIPQDVGPPRFSTRTGAVLGVANTVAMLAGNLTGGLIGDVLFQRRYKLMLMITFAAAAICFAGYAISLPSAVSETPLLPSTALSVTACVRAAPPPPPPLSVPPAPTSAPWFVPDLLCEGVRRYAKVCEARGRCDAPLPDHVTPSFSLSLSVCFACSRVSFGMDEDEDENENEGWGGTMSCYVVCCESHKV